MVDGAGEMTGLLQPSECAVLEMPGYLTATMAVGRVYDGAVAAANAADPAVGTRDVVIQVAGGIVAHGAGSAGTGMVCFGWKRGISTASRLAPDGSRCPRRPAADAPRERPRRGG